MTSDQYQTCPGGRGKKIKFCCGKNTQTELDKIGRAIEGQQYEAALQQLDKMIADDPQRECAWAVKCTMLLKTGRMEEAKATIDECLKIAPDNPVALAELSVIKDSRLGELDQNDEHINAQVEEILNDAVSTLHMALENSDKHMSTQVFEAIGILGELLIESGHILAGRE
ncbi:MAG: tetratricopeptide repeat protein, partial [Planctomycetota bacterium]